MNAIASPSSALTPAAEKILATASELFYAYGIHAVGVDRIVAESGVTKKTLYDRFGSKEQLVLAYLRRREDQWRLALSIELRSHPIPGTERILAVFDAADTWYTGRSLKGCSAVNARAEEGPEVQEHLVVREVMEQKRWMLRSFVDLCTEAGMARPDETGKHLLLILEGALVTLGTHSFEDPMRVAKEAAHMILTPH
ncbi:TetR/AcrR family transcriptional regulator [Leucobacter sp. USHLN153]|uniref:TetR/AcrR family transcriptional regulator n=1 Tax=Leucobacter sp. USHLN153 TaxID=3081268 RepID=UPI003015A28A